MKGKIRAARERAEHGRPQCPVLGAHRRHHRLHLGLTASGASGTDRPPVPSGVWPTCDSDLPLPGDEAAVLAAHRDLAAEGLHLRPRLRGGDGLGRVPRTSSMPQRTGPGPAPRTGCRPRSWWPTSTDRVVGRVSVRHRLDDWLRHEGGHIGYAVVPGERRQGYATEILRQALAVAAGGGGRTTSSSAATRGTWGRPPSSSPCGGAYDSTVEGT